MIRLNIICCEICQIHLCRERIGGYEGGTDMLMSGTVGFFIIRQMNCTFLISNGFHRSDRIENVIESHKNWTDLLDVERIRSVSNKIWNFIEPYDSHGSLKELNGSCRIQTDFIEPCMILYRIWNPLGK
jgi:hypothetical protein